MLGRHVSACTMGLYCLHYYIRLLAFVNKSACVIFVLVPVNCNFHNEVRTRWGWAGPESATWMVLKSGDKDEWANTGEYANWCERIQPVQWMLLKNFLIENNSLQLK